MRPTLSPRACVRLWELTVDQPDVDAARRLWQALYPVTQFFEAEGYVASVKAATELRGIRSARRDYRRCRSPTRPAVAGTASPGCSKQLSNRAAQWPSRRCRSRCQHHACTLIEDLPTILTPLRDHLTMRSIKARDARPESERAEADRPAVDIRGRYIADSRRHSGRDVPARHPNARGHAGEPSRDQPRPASRSIAPTDPGRPAGTSPPPRGVRRHAWTRTTSATSISFARRWRSLPRSTSPAIPSSEAIARLARAGRVDDRGGQPPRLGASGPARRRVPSDHRDVRSAASA